MTAQPFRFPVRVYYEDTDAAGVVYYANYLKFMERARTEWLDHHGLALAELERTHGVVFVVTRAEIDFRGAARLGDRLEATVAFEPADMSLAVAAGYGLIPAELVGSTPGIPAWNAIPEPLTLVNGKERLTLRFDGSEEESGAKVTLSSLHSAKGLEFEYVFLIGCVEGYLPHSRTTDPKVTEAIVTDVEEERRLFYVGVTRARERLYLSWPVRRNVRGRVAPFVPSRFLDGLPEEWTETMDAVDTKPLGHDETADAASAILAMLAGKS